ncbi:MULTISPECIES: 2-amino-4-hydroxy-6-hydroxymethyldihydropteridine diphosphokinase [unclassified Ruegeria]|uniref:2-amino-4-hydroxy-6- hydroxymethyldihydropteridine diphosphokinase n=1 Tax=unclassified Ruegeria TaxID=2625375 RepID=UPI00148923CB|nr:MULTISPECIES: 2-amino-4-hydroxy-6-hydroxymethyldihydropteridine diphosphokinase [unclassified Ruegeria]
MEVSLVNNTLDTVVALGANLSLRSQSPEMTLERAVDAMETSGLVIRARSRFYKTPCFPAGSGPDYVNAAVLVGSELPSRSVLDILHEIENRFGRQRQQRWGMRTLDLDMVCCGDQVSPSLKEYNHWRLLPSTEQMKSAPEQLILPHPRLQDRAFVLVPMADILPDWTHPVLGQTVRQMLDNLPDEDISAIQPL